MAKAKEKEKPVSTAGYFKQLFTDHPDWLGEGSNQQVIDRWKEDHPGQEVTKSILNGLANTKSLMRKKLGLGKARRRKRRKGAAAPQAATVAKAGTAVKKSRAPFAMLEKMEGLIDDCLTLARQQNSEGLEDLVKHLRIARRAVAWQMGEPTAARG